MSLGRIARVFHDKGQWSMSAGMLAPAMDCPTEGAMKQQHEQTPKINGLDSPDQVRRRGNTIEVALWYPPRHDPPRRGDRPNDNARYIEVGLECVRAADSIRIHYDYERDGYAVEQPKRTQVLVESTPTMDRYDEQVDWIETAFLPAWPFEHPEETGQ